MKLNDVINYEKCLMILLKNLSEFNQSTIIH